MNTVERYLSHLFEFKDSEFEVVRTQATKAEQLNLLSNDFVLNVQEIIDDLPAIGDDWNEAQVIEFKQVSYILQKVIEYYPAVYNKSNYKENRLKEYPPIGDQLDALFHAGLFPQEMAAKIQAVKDKYPKPSNSN